MRGSVLTIDWSVQAKVLACLRSVAAKFAVGRGATGGVGATQEEVIKS